MHQLSGNSRTFHIAITAHLLCYPVSLLRIYNPVWIFFTPKVSFETKEEDWEFFGGGEETFGFICPLNDCKLIRGRRGKVRKRERKATQGRRNIRFVER
jgi:hypothetical protein